MIKVGVSENFPITAMLLDEATGSLVSDAIVTYDVRNIDDTQLNPAINGYLSESTVVSGIYKTVLSIPEEGSYICYAMSDGFITSTEEVLVSSTDINLDNFYALIKQNRHYNLSIEDVIRGDNDATLSQIARNVPKRATDYIITRIKNDDDPDWGNTTISGIVYAHYRSTNDKAPYKIGGPF